MLCADRIAPDFPRCLARTSPPAVFILLLFVFFFFFSLVITSTSGMAVLTMPIMGTLAVLINIPGSEIVNAYLYGMNLMLFISPTAMLLPSLAL
ncbi:MAG: YfcC family protein, partial [Fibrella sp.]|nr:YfcC family protein [Armatimonadota bacterium]